ncbi:MAG: GTPase, partial [Methylophilaceae bacterium]
MSIIHNLKYIHSAHFIDDLPEDTGFEIAFAGRSNAGKSSAINALANHNRLAYVSKQPGRTQLI